METHKKLVIINPSANSGKTQKIVGAVREILRNENAEFVVTQQPNHATQIARTAGSYEMVITIGGDGTINEVVNGLMAIEQNERPVLALVPSGSGNDACRMAGIPLDVAEALTTTLTGTHRTFDVGRCNDTYFLNSCSVGIDASVVAKTNELKATKKLTGAPLYTRALMHVILHNLKATDVTMKLDTLEPFAKKILLCAVTNGKTYGSGIAINPSANPSDGKLSVATVDEIGMRRVLSYLPALAAKKHERIAEYHAIDFDTFTLTSATGAALVAQRDGEIFTDTVFHFETIKGALEIMTPCVIE